MFRLIAAALLISGKDWKKLGNFKWIDNLSLFQPSLVTISRSVRSLGPHTILVTPLKLE